MDFLEQEAILHRKRGNSGSVLWIDASVGSDDYWSLASRDNFAQSLNVPSSKVISTVEVECYVVSTSGSIAIEFWDGADRSTATQIGTSSATALVDYVASAGNPGQLFEFTWASAPTLTSDCYMHIVPVSGAAVFVRSHTDEDTYEDTNHDIHWGNDGSVAELGGHQDLSFKIYTN